MELQDYQMIEKHEFRRRLYTVVLMLIIFGPLLIVASCGERSFGPPIEKQVNFEETSIKLVVYQYNTTIELERAAIEHNTNPRVVGFAVTSWQPPLARPTKPHCEVHIMRVQGVGDYRRMEDLGHEVLHCLYGLYHERGVR